MSLSTMESQTARTINPVMVEAERYLASFAGVRITQALWDAIVLTLFTMVSPASRVTAQLARVFYDAERSRVLPDAPRHDIPLSLLEFDTFVKDMSAVAPQVVGQELTPEKINRINLRAARSIENSGRWTIMWAVEEPDPWFDTVEEEEGEPPPNRLKPEHQELKDTLNRKQRVKGWARVPTGKETCAWCLMLCSRGAAYRSPQGAGSKLDYRTSLKYERSGLFDPQEHMNQWHDGCDCKIVPVFDLENWDGRKRADAAYKMWSIATKNTSGADSVRAFRREVESGRLDINDFM